MTACKGENWNKNERQSDFFVIFETTNVFGKLKNICEVNVICLEIKWSLRTKVSETRCKDIKNCQTTLKFKIGKLNL